MEFGCWKIHVVYIIYQRILEKSKNNHNKFEQTQRLKQINKLKSAYKKSLYVCRKMPKDS